MKEYFSTYSKEQIFILDEDGNNYESFGKAIRAIEEIIKPAECNFKHDFFDGGIGFFIKDGLKVKITCSNWDGTELRIKENLSKSELSKVRQWAKDIYNFIHNN